MHAPQSTARDSVPLTFDSILLQRANKLRLALNILGTPRTNAQSIQSRLPPPEVTEGLLAGSLDQIYTAREGFTHSAQNLLSTFVLLYTASSAVAGWLLTLDKAPTFFQSLLISVAGLLLAWLPFILSPYLRSKVRAAYDLYIAASVHASIVTHALGLPHTHKWTELVDACNTVHGHFEPNRPNLTAAFEDEDTCDFIPQATIPSGNQSPLVCTSLGQLNAVWASKPGTLLEYYNVLFGRVRWISSITLSLLFLAAIAFAWFAPLQVWGTGKLSGVHHQGSNHQLSTPTPCRIQVIRMDGRIPLQYLLRVSSHSPIGLTRFGDIVVDGACRGEIFYIMNRNYSIVYIGEIPYSGDTTVLID